MNQSSPNAADAIRRAHYLQAMGIDAYVSRQPLPGAASTSRLGIVAPQPQPQPQPAPGRQATAPAARPELPSFDTVPGRANPPKDTAAAPASAEPARPASQAPAVKFSMGVIICSDLAWVETLDGYPLAREQVQLVHAMTRAVGSPPAKPRVAQFDWPMHNNPQLDQGAEAAAASLAAYLDRHLGEANCRALVCLGEAAARLAPREALGSLKHVSTHSTREMLENPASKRQVWADLQAILAT